MAKKKFTDDEYLKFLNEQLEKFENNNDLSTSDPLNSEQEYDILNELANRPNEVNRRQANISGYSLPINFKNSNRQGAQEDSGLAILPDGQGTFQTYASTPTINFVSAKNEKKLVSRNNNAAIILGSDRPHSLASGKGGKGAAAANTIDIVVGRMSCKQPDISSGKVKAVDPNFACDASRIYISQLTDVDLNFGIVPGISGRGDQMIGRPPPSRAAIALKSDKVRVIGKEGVKIVTGRSYAFGSTGRDGETNSQGGKIPRAAPIELIAGNNDGTRTIGGGLFNAPQTVNNLQGVPYGENLVDMMMEVHESIDLLTACVQRHSQLMTIMSDILSIATFEPWRAAGAPLISKANKVFVSQAIHHLRINSKLIKVGYLEPYGAKYIVSQNVFAT